MKKPKLNIKEVLISKVLINSNISHEEFLLINNDLKQEIKNLAMRQFIEDFSQFIKQCFCKYNKYKYNKYNEYKKCCFWKQESM